MNPEPIANCRTCRGGRVLPGPVACGACHGEGRVVRAVGEPAPTKTCRRCGVSYDRDAFRALPYVGPQADGLGGFLELRNCTCGSTIAALPEWEGEPC